MIPKSVEVVEAFDEVLSKQIIHETDDIQVNFLRRWNPQRPIWDSNVLSKLHLKTGTYQNKEKRIKETVEIYQEIEYWYKGFLQSKGGKKYLDTFDEAFPEYKSFSSVKNLIP